MSRFFCLMLALVLACCGCGETKQENTEEQKMILQINETPVNVRWEENESVKALMELVKESPLAIEMSPYGGFEQVGPIGKSLPRNDVQTATSAGDIVLYSGDQIVVFHGTNSWAYTRLGKITDMTAEELSKLLGGEGVTLKLTLERE